MKRRLLIILVILVIFVLSSGITYSAFTSRTYGNVDQNIAKFIFETKLIDHIELPLVDIAPGQVEEYQFAVTNNLNKKISDVLLNYQIILKTYHLMPLKIELYKLDNGEELIMTCDENYTRDENKQLLCNSPVQEMGYSREETVNYKLKVIFPEEYNDEIYANLVDYVDVEIKSWQKIDK